MNIYIMNKEDKTKEVKECVELDVNDLKSAIKIITSLRIAISNIRLYPSSSKIVSNSVNDVFGKIQNFITKYSHFTISEVSNNLIINGTILKKHLHSISNEVYDSFIQTLMQSHIKSLSFIQGMNMEQFLFFLQIFAEKHWRREGDMMVLTTILKEKGIDTIKLNEKIYKAVGEDDIVLDNAMDYLKRAEGELDILVRTLEEVVEISNLSKDGVINAEVKENIINKILELKPEILVNFCQRKKGPQFEKVKQEIIEGLPSHQLKELITKIIGVYKEIKENTPEGSKKESELLKLKETINGLLSACKDRDTTLSIFNELKDENLEELLPLWWDKPEKSEIGLMVTKARLMLEKDSLELLSSDSGDEFCKIIKEMENIGKDDIIKGLIEKIKENFAANTAATRLQAAEFYIKVKPTLLSLTSGELATSLENTILKMIETESDDRVYGVLAKILKDSVTDAVKDYDYEKAWQILSIFRKHRTLKKEGFMGRNSRAADYLQGVASSNMLRLLVNDLRSRDRARQKNAYKVLIQMEEFITPEITNAIKNTQDLGLREIMAGVLKKIGSNAVLSLISELEKDLPAVHLVRIIEVLPSLECDTLSLKKLQHTINHHEPSVRIETIKCALHLKGERVELLKYSLTDDNIPVRILAIESLGEMGEKELYYQFYKKRKTVAEEKAFCEAIGKLKNNECVKYLLSRTKPNYFWQKRRPREVKIAAVRSLEHYPGVQTRKSLEKLITSKDKFISSNAKYVLEKM